jgi:endonuclease I
MRHISRALAVWLVLVILARYANAQSYDPPANYYSTATGTGATLKQQLNNIIDGHTDIGYNAARSALQVTDADPNKPGYMITVYDRTSLNVATLGPVSGIPGWDGGVTWNREHTWPQSRIPDGSPAASDLFNLRPALTANNGDRANYNFGGTFGQPFGLIAASPNPYWYPGDADAGMIARQEFYMAARYDGADASTSDLEVVAGNPTATSGVTTVLGDLNRMLEWHYLAPPTDFERRRNQIIYDSYQHNRDPFIDRPEYVWSVFVNQTNDSSLTLQGGSATAAAASTLNLDLGRVLVGATVPAAQSVVINKSGLNGTYYQVTAAGAATSTVTGRYNAFATGVAGSKSITVGLNTTTAAAGLKSGSVTIDNLDVTTGGGTGHGANDGNDTVNVSLSVLNHANASFSGVSDVNSLTYDFGTISMGAPSPTFSFDIFNLPTTAGFTAGLDLDSIGAAGQSTLLTTDLAAFNGASTLAAGGANHFTAALNTSMAGDFSATYTLNFSDENLPGAAALGNITLTLTGVVQASATANADFNGDGFVDGADFVLWQRGLGMTAASAASGDANGDQTVDAADFAIWKNQFATTPAASAVPEPGIAILLTLAIGLSVQSGRAKHDTSVRRRSRSN